MRALFLLIFATWTANAMLPQHFAMPLSELYFEENSMSARYLLTGESNHLETASSDGESRPKVVNEDDSRPTALVKAQDRNGIQHYSWGTFISDGIYNGMHPATILQSHEEFEVSDNDNRKFRFVQLNNGLKAMLIQDADATKSAAAINYKTGSLADSDAFPGLAHFHEHMLFMGSESFPGEDTYKNFMTENGGSSNAFTASEDVGFYFQVKNDKFFEALKMFVSFFTEPLLDPKNTKKEINAVHNEHSKNIPSPGRRYHRLMEMLIQEDHRAHRFKTGNSETLDKPGIHDALLEFHKQYTNANIMSGAFISNLTLDEMQRFVNHLFSNIPSEERDYPQIGPVKMTNLPMIVALLREKEQHVLHYSWYLPSFDDKYKYAPLALAKSLINSPAENGLVYSLKQKRFIHSLSFGTELETGFNWRVTMLLVLTKEGEKHVAEISQIIFDYLRLVKTGITKSRWDDREKVAALHFKFLVKQTGYARNASNIAAALMNKQPNDSIYPGFNCVPSECTFNFEVAQEALSFLTPESLILVHEFPKKEVLKDLEGKKAFSEMKSEHFYGLEYAYEPIPQTFVEKWKQDKSDGKLKLPHLNHWIPSNTEMLDLEDSGILMPWVISCEPNGSCLHYKATPGYKVPKALIAVNLYFTGMDILENMIGYSLWLSCFSQMMSEKYYDAGAMGYSASFSQHPRGMRIKFYGFHDRLHEFATTIMKATSDDLQKCRFDLFKEQLLTGFANKKYQTIQRQAGMFLGLAKHPDKSTIKQMVAVAEKMTRETMKNWIAYSQSIVGYDALAIGNIDQENAQNLVAVITKHCEACKGVPKPTYVQYTDYLDAGRVVLQFKNTNPSDTNSLLFYSIILESSEELRETAMTSMIRKVLNDAIFKAIRTDAGLAYIASAGIGALGENKTLTISIVSGKTDPYDLEQRVERVIEEFSTPYGQKFENLKDTIITQLQKTPETLGQEADRYWNEINSQRYDFKRHQDLVEEMQTLTAQEVWKFYKTIRKRSRMVVQGFGPSRGFLPQPERYESARYLNKENLITIRSEDYHEVLEWRKKFKTILWPKYLEENERQQLLAKRLVQEKEFKEELRQMKLNTPPVDESTISAPQWFTILFFILSVLGIAYYAHVKYQESANVKSVVQFKRKTKVKTPSYSPNII